MAGYEGVLVEMWKERDMLTDRIVERLKDRDPEQIIRRLASFIPLPLLLHAVMFFEGESDD